MNTKCEFWIHFTSYSTRLPLWETGVQTMKYHDMFYVHFLKACQKVDLYQSFLFDYEVCTMIQCLGLELPEWKSRSRPDLAYLVMFHSSSKVSVMPQSCPGTTSLISFHASSQASETL